MNEWYERKAAEEIGDYDEYTRWNKEVENYRRMAGE